MGLQHYQTKTKLLKRLTVDLLQSNDANANDFRYILVIYFSNIMFGTVVKPIALDILSGRRQQRRRRRGTKEEEKKNTN